jgi:uncharacterized protein
LERGAPLTICAAAMLGREADVQTFLKQDPTLVNGRGAHGIHIIFHAALSGNTRMMEMLTTSDTPHDELCNALHAAVAQNDLHLAEWLLARGLNDLNPLNYEGKTPLKVAQERDHTAVAELLAAHGAKAD